MQPVKLRHIGQTLNALGVSDGAGVNLLRTIGTPGLLNLDPFLLLDEFRSDDPDDYIAGFPPHPHRGFETVTYMKAGKMRHEDSTGRSGQLISGGVQWMTAGRGIIHSETPEQEDGLMWGFQLWVNLPAPDKMQEPGYQEFSPEEIPVVEEPGMSVRVIAGHYAETPGAVRGIATSPVYLDVQLTRDQVFELDIPEAHCSFIYPYSGSIDVQGHGVSQSELAVLEDGNRVAISARGEDSGFLFIAGQPLGEPIVRHGPFVMNTQEEIKQAIKDMQDGTLDKAPI
jgi:redox-sensitive bicupin YhaK (pirin superfamily)